jgi:hypothetical protein
MPPAMHRTKPGSAGVTPVPMATGTAMSANAIRQSAARRRIVRTSSFSVLTVATLPCGPPP